MYAKFYKLTGKPFQLAPDPRFFYASRSHKRAMAYLLYGVKQGEGFIVITGNVGTGKTTLVQHLLRVLKNEDVVAAQIVTTQILADDLLRLVAAAYGLPYQRVSKAALLKSLEAYFRACYQEGRRVLLIVDEAQNLPRRSIEELRMLSNFQIGGSTLVQSFLLGQKEFRTTMRSDGFEQLRQRVIAAYHLQPLGSDEAKGYVEHRLRTVGWKNDPQFDEDAFQEINSFTAGVPRRINLFCDRLLLYVYLEELHHISRKSVATVARDIAGEQGGAIADEPGPPPVPTSTPRNIETEQSDNSRHGKKAGPMGKQKDRLGAVEDSVEALGTAVREELSLLRQAIAAAQRPNKEKK